MPDLEKDMQKKEKDTSSKDERVSNFFQDNKKEKKDDLTTFNSVN